MLGILGWIIVVWLSGSVIYSTQFHLLNYFNSSDADFVIAQKMHGPEHVEKMSKKNFLKKVFELQIYKIIIILILLYLLI